MSEHHLNEYTSKRADRLSRWKLKPRSGFYSAVLVPGSLCHDEAGFLWVVWPDRSIRAFDGSMPRSLPWSAQYTMPWPVLLLRDNLNTDDCNRIVRKILVEESLESEVDGSRARAEIFDLTLAAKSFAAAVCELAQKNVATFDDVLLWINRTYSISAVASPWLQHSGRHVAWGALQLRRRSCTNSDVNVRVLQKLTAHALEVIDIVKANKWTPTEPAVASLWAGDASPWTCDPLLDSRGNACTRSFALFRQVPSSLYARSVQDHSDINMWWTEEHIAAMLRDPQDPSERSVLPCFVGERSWRSHVPTVIGRINVPEHVAGDPNAVERLRRLWRMRVTTACRTKKIAAHIPPFMPEVIEVFS